VSGTSNIGGISQPIISQRKVEHDIRLREGEVNLLGGIFEIQDSKSIAGLPGLAQLPFLRYLFSSERKEVLNNEIVFVLIPHIVRGQELTELNQREIEVGTGSTIDLRRVTRSQPNAAVTPAPQQPVQLNQQPPSSQSVSPNTNPSGAPPPHAGMTPQPTIEFDPARTNPSVGSTFSVNLLVKNIKEVASAPMQISYDPKMLTLTNISNGDLLSKDGQVVTLVHREDTERGTIQVNAERPPNSGGISGDGVLFTLTFQAKAAGESQLNVQRPTAKNSSQQPIPLATAPAVVTVR